MFDVIHSFVVQFLGNLPLELTWVYGIVDVVIICFFIFLIMSPFLLLFMIFNDRRG